ncbi:hypothetical protein [Haloglomus irregulare]|jgi:hypothetical protein
MSAGRAPDKVCCQLDYSLIELLVRYDLVHEAVVVHRLSIVPISGQEYFASLTLSDDVTEPLDPSSGWDDTEIYLRLSELRSFTGDTEVSVRCKFHSAPECEAVNPRDNEHCEIDKPTEYGLTSLGEPNRLIWFQIVGRKL